MKATISHSVTGTTTITVTYERNELRDIELKLNPFDIRLINECQKSKNISDWLLAAECIARKIEALKHETPSW